MLTDAVRSSAVPRLAMLARVHLRSRVASRSFAWKCAAVALIGGMAGYLDASATLDVERTINVAAGFEGKLAVALYVAVLVEVVAGLRGRESVAWLTPLFARGLRRETLPLVVIVAAALAYGVLWTVGAGAFRLAGAGAGLWNPAPALARLPTVWAGMFAVAAYGAACAALTATRSNALGLAVAFPAASLLLVVGFVSTTSTIPPLWSRVPLLLLPPLGAEPDPAIALRYARYALVLGAMLTLLAHRWVGRSA